MTQVFKKLDTLNNGVITIMEIEEAINEAKLNKDNEAKHCLKELKKFMNNNNQSLNLTYTDFLMATLDKNKLDKKKWVAAFQHFDIDNSGVITIDNLRQVMERAGKKVTEEEIKEMIKEFRLEVHGPNEISFAQFMALIERDGLNPISESKNFLPDPIDLNESLDSISSGENKFSKTKYEVPKERSESNLNPLHNEINFK